RVDAARDLRGPRGRCARARLGPPGRIARHLRRRQRQHLPGDRPGRRHRTDHGCAAARTPRQCLRRRARGKQRNRRWRPVRRRRGRQWWTRRRRACGGAAMTATAPLRIALIGTSGYGKTHLQNLERLTAAGLAELIGVVDIAEPLEQLRGIWYRDLAALLAAHAQAPPEVVIIATPIDTHVPL